MKWSKEDDRLLRMCYPALGSDIPELSAKYSKKAIIAHAASIGVRCAVDRSKQINLGNKHALGYKDSPDRIRQKSERMKGRVVSSETRAKLSTKLKGRVMDDQWRRRLSDGHKGQVPSDHNRRRSSEANKGKEFSLEHRKRISVALTGHKVNKNTKMKISASYRPHSKSTNTDIERMIAGLLSALGIRFVHSYKINSVGWVDFFIPDINGVIECDGDYWHSLPGAKDRDNRKTEAMIGLGHSVLRLPGSKIKNDWDATVSIVREFLLESGI